MTRSSFSGNDVLHKTAAVGQYFGFRPLSTLTAKTRGMQKAKAVAGATLNNVSLDPAAQTVAQFLKHLQSTDVQPSPRQPLFVWHTNIAPGRPTQKKIVVQLHALGSDRPISDAVLIRALIALTRDLYHEEPNLRINSMGDKETRARYTRELGVFFKKRAVGLPEECLERAKTDTFDAAEYAIANACAEDLPSPTEHLSDASRKRFEDLLEYLEMTETPYELARKLISRGNAWNDVCFELMVGGERVAWGSRYNELARHFFPSASLTAAGAVLTLSGEGAIAKEPPRTRLRFSFVHIGDEAKRISIRLADDFRKAHVPLTQYIGTETLTEQLGLAERDNSPYLLIMGRKEALEGSAILRNKQTQVETILPVASLIDELKAVVA
jgi:histidyl-tRNA synthetase